MISVFKLDDCDWWAGESLEACIAAARQECGADTYEDAETEGRELSAEAMQRLVYVDESDPGPPVERTFAEQLAREVAEGGAFPRLFASTEY